MLHGVVSSSVFLLEFSKLDYTVIDLFVSSNINDFAIQKVAKKRIQTFLKYYLLKNGLIALNTA